MHGLYPDDPCLPYQQVNEALDEPIARGRCTLGAKLPSRREIADASPVHGYNHARRAFAKSGAGCSIGVSLELSECWNDGQN